LNLHHAPGPVARLKRWAKLNRLVDEAVAQLAAGRPADRTVVEKQEVIKPHWNGGNRELWYGGALCVRYTKVAPYQERILKSFEELGWPSRIDDPLPPGKLMNTIPDMQDKLKAFDSPIAFGRDGTARGIRWWVRSEQ
jgi:hypothetical protein